VPIKKKWSKYSKENLKKLGKTTGGYEVADKNKKHLGTGKSESPNVGVASRIKTKKKKHPAIQHFRVEEESFFESGGDIERRHAAAYRKKHNGKNPPIDKRLPS